MDRIPTWPELARSIVQARLDAEGYREAAAVRGNRREAASWAKEIGKLDHFMAKNGITIRYA